MARLRQAFPQDVFTLHMSRAGFSARGSARPAIIRKVYLCVKDSFCEEIVPFWSLKLLFAALP